MKKTAVRECLPVDPPSPCEEASEESGGDLQCIPVGQSRKTNTANATTTQANRAVPSPRKSSMPVEKSKGRIPRTTSLALSGPSRSRKEKDSTAGNKKPNSQTASANSDSRTDSVGDDTIRGQGISNVNADSEDKPDKSTAPAKCLVASQPIEREITESFCRKQLASLRSEEKRPPPITTLEIFASMFLLAHEGINSHKLKIGRDITLQDVEEVFGVEKSKNGFSMAEKLSGNLRKQAEELYCLCYQKPYAATHVAKEFAIGFVLDKVRHQRVNWAEFATKTNLSQRKSYARRVRGCIQRLATVLNVPVHNLYEAEGFIEYAETLQDKFGGVGEGHCHVGEEHATKEDANDRSSFQYDGRSHADLLAIRKAEVAELLPKFEALLQRNESKVQDKKAHVTQATVQWDACFHLVEQFKSSLSEAGQDYSIFAGEEEMEAATKQPGIGPILKMYYSNVKKLSAFAVTKSAVESELQTVSTAMTATSSRLLALQKYSVELSAGKDSVLMRPLPSCGDDNTADAGDVHPLLPSLLRRSIFSDGFPLWNVILCSCQHVYHPWCAAQWFRTNISCVVSECRLVSSLWYRSWGFGEYDKILQQHTSDLHKAATDAVPPAELVEGPSKNVLGSSLLSQGAPSMSACDSTVSKCFGERQPEFRPRLMRLGSEGCEATPLQTPAMDIHNSYTQFGSQLSTPCKLRSSSTVMSLLETSPPVLQHALDKVVGNIPCAPSLELHSMELTEAVQTVCDLSNKSTEDPSDFFSLDKDDPLLQSESCRPQLNALLHMEDDIEVILPCKTPAHGSPGHGVSLPSEKTSPPARNVVQDISKDPYSMTLERSSKRCKKTTENFMVAAPSESKICSTNVLPAHSIGKGNMDCLTMQWTRSPWLTQAAECFAIDMS